MLFCQIIKGADFKATRAPAFSNDSVSNSVGVNDSNKYLYHMLVHAFKVFLSDSIMSLLWEVFLHLWCIFFCCTWNVFCYLCWAVAGPSCKGTRRRTPAAWRTHYRSSASARTGRSWRAASCALWKREEEGEETVERVERKQRQQWKKRQTAETYTGCMLISLSHSSCYSLHNK